MCAKVAVKHQSSSSQQHPAHVILASTVSLVSRADNVSNNLKFLKPSVIPLTLKSRDIISASCKFPFLSSQNKHTGWNGSDVWIGHEEALLLRRWCLTGHNVLVCWIYFPALSALATLHKTKHVLRHLALWLVSVFSIPIKPSSTRDTLMINGT